MKELKNAMILKTKSTFVHVKISWRSGKVSTRLKLPLIKALMLSVLLCGCHTWKTNDGDNKADDVFQNTCL